MPTINYKNGKGQRVPGTTTVIGQNLGWNKQQLMWWANQEGLAGRNHRDTSQRAADAGTIAHYLIECDIRKLKPDCSKWEKELVDKAETCFLNYLHWKDTMRFEPDEPELSLVSEKHQYGGTLDCPCIINGKHSLFDWKTSGGVYPDYVIQIMAYKNLWEENFPAKPLTGGIYLLRIDKEDASWAFHYWQDVPDAWEAFKHLRELHSLRQKLKKV